MTYWKIQNNSDEDIVIMVIGNKLDLVEKDPATRSTSNEIVKSFCTLNNLIYYESSAKIGYNVKESFEDLIECYYNHYVIEIYQK